MAHSPIPQHRTPTTTRSMDSSEGAAQQRRAKKASSTDGFKKRASGRSTRKNSMDSSNSNSTGKRRTRPLESTSNHSSNTASTSPLDMDASFASVGSASAGRRRRSNQTAKRLSGNHRSAPNLNLNMSAGASTFAKGILNIAEAQPDVVPETQQQQQRPTNEPRSKRSSDGTSNSKSQRRGRTTKRHSDKDLMDESSRREKSAPRSKSMGAKAKKSSSTRSKSQSTKASKTTSLKESSSDKNLKSKSTDGKIEKGSTRPKRSKSAAASSTKEKKTRSKSAGANKRALSPKKPAAITKTGKAVSTGTSLTTQALVSPKKERTTRKNRQSVLLPQHQKEIETASAPNLRGPVNLDDSSSSLDDMEAATAVPLTTTAFPTYSSDTRTRTVTFGGDHGVIYEDTQEPTTKWYSKEDLQMLLNHEISISWRLAESNQKGSVAKSLHCCWRGFEHIQFKYNKADRNHSHVTNVLTAQRNLHQQQSVLNVSPEVTAEKLRVVSRADSKDDRKRAYKLGLGDADEIFTDVQKQRMDAMQAEVDHAAKALAVATSKSQTSARAARKVVQQVAKGTAVEKAALSTRSAAVNTKKAITKKAGAVKDKLRSSGKSLASGGSDRSLGLSGGLGSSKSEHGARSHRQRDESPKRGSTGSLFTMWGKEGEEGRKSRRNKRSPLVESLVD